MLAFSSKLLILVQPHIAVDTAVDSLEESKCLTPGLTVKVYKQTYCSLLENEKGNSDNENETKSRGVCHIYVFAVLFWVFLTFVLNV